MGPKTCLDGGGKSRPPLGFDPRTVQPVASCYTDWAIPVPSSYSDEFEIIPLLNRPVEATDIFGAFTPFCVMSFL